MEKVLLATVGDVEITKDHMIGILRNIPKEHAQSVAGVEGRRRLLDEMISGELLALDALSQGLDQDEDYLAIVEEAKRGLLQRFAVNKLFASIHVTQEEAQAYYEENKEQFSASEQASAKHILVDSEDKCASIKEEISAGKSFEEAAMEYSSCPSKESGGDLGTFGKGQMVKEFEEAVFLANVGDVVGPVKTQFGYHLIRVEAIEAAGVESFDAVETAIKNQLAQGKQQEVYEAKIAELKNVYPIKVNLEAIK
jgi:peptidyl-prolyl cis-trans isomerase C